MGTKKYSSDYLLTLIIAPLALGTAAFSLSWLCSMGVFASSLLGLGSAAGLFLGLLFKKKPVAEILDALDLDDLEDLVEDFGELILDTAKEHMVSERSSPARKLGDLHRSRDRAVKELAKQTDYQLQHAEHLLGRIELLLLAKLSPSEITFVRYKQSAETVSNGILSNIQLLEDKLLTLEQLGYSKSRDKSRRGKKRKKHKKNRAQESLTALEELGSKVRVLLEENDKALAKLEELAIALASLQISSGIPATSLGQALSDLDDLISQVDKYDSSSSASNEAQPVKSKDEDKILS